VVSSGTDFGSPTASSAIERAAINAWSMNVAFICSDSALVSKSSFSGSCGSQAAASISTASRSRMLLAYSRRFSRRSGTCPTCGEPRRAWSSVDSSQPIMLRTAARSGCFSVGGGIRPLWSFLIVASQIFGSPPTSSGDMVSNAMLPAQSVALWQPKQYCSMVCQFAAGAAALVAGGEAAAGIAPGAPASMPRLAMTVMFLLFTCSSDVVVEIRISDAAKPEHKYCSALDPPPGWR
jgi:hypothetical protein